jgi:hypothetical protein
MEFQKKQIVEGIILIISCQKHEKTRLKEFRLKNNEYSGWKVIYVLGDFFLECKYKLNENLMTVKCEDSYIHLFKKLVLSIKYIYEIYEIKQGVLRCGDYLVFNEDNLTKFLEIPIKLDLMGCSPVKHSIFNPKLSQLKEVKEDYFMCDYYLNHQEDVLNPQHNLKNVDISKYIKRPKIDIGVGGNMYYISNKSCNCLVQHMENINYDIFHFDEFTQSYPYTIEDCAASFILYLNGIGFYNIIDFVEDQNFDNFYYNVAVSTNKYR